jgi:hypothetical protein
MATRSKKVQETALDFTELNFELKSSFLDSRGQLQYAQKPRKYTRDQVRTYLENPATYAQQLRDISWYLLISSAQYRRLIGHFAGMLTFDHVLVPMSVSTEKMSNDQFRKAYDAAQWYMEKFNVKHEFSKIVANLMIEGVFFGYEWQDKNTFMIQKLPTQYCRISGNEDGCWTTSFNFSYFDSDPLILENYPSEFKSMYNAYKRDSQNMTWQDLDSGKSICIKFDETNLFLVPPFTGVFEDAMDLREYKDLFKTKTKVENYKLLVQKIPFKESPKSDKDFLISLPSVKTFHTGVKSAVPEGVGVVSTPMDIQDFTFEKVATKDDTVGMAERNFYSSSGTSQMLFNSDKSGAVGITRSLEADQGFMFPLLRQIERYFKKRMTSQITKNGAYQFKVYFPDITIYNRGEMFDRYLKSAEYGFPATLAAATLGLNVADLVALSNMENTFLGMKDIMVPLASAHTSSSSDGGRPSKNDQTLSDAGAKTKDNGSNAETKAKK